MRAGVTFRQAAILVAPLVLTVMGVLALAVAAVLLLAVATAAADPSAMPGLDPGTGTSGLLQGGDPRSDGEGPGLVGSPLLILLAVVALGLVTVAATALVARLTRRA